MMQLSSDCVSILSELEILTGSNPDSMTIIPSSSEPQPLTTPSLEQVLGPDGRHDDSLRNKTTLLAYTSHIALEIVLIRIRTIACVVYERNVIYDCVSALKRIADEAGCQNEKEQPFIFHSDGEISTVANCTTTLTKTLILLLNRTDHQEEPTTEDSDDTSDVKEANISSLEAVLKSHLSHVPSPLSSHPSSPLVTIPILREHNCRLSDLVHLKNDLTQFLESFSSNSKFPTQPNSTFLPTDASGLGALLFTHMSLISPSAMGTFFSSPNQLPQDTLTAFASHFDFSSMTLDDGLYKFLSTFRLPSEGQQIYRIVTAFASSFFPQNKSLFPEEDSVFRVAYSLIMLHSFAHNGKISEYGMDVFVSQNLGNGLDKPELERIYERVAGEEIAIALDDDERGIRGHVEERKKMTSEDWKRKQRKRALENKRRNVELLRAHAKMSVSPLHIDLKSVASDPLLSHSVQTDLISCHLLPIVSDLAVALFRLADTSAQIDQNIMSHLDILMLSLQTKHSAVASSTISFLSQLDAISAGFCAAQRNVEVLSPLSLSQKHIRSAISLIRSVMGKREDEGRGLSREFREEWVIVILTLLKLRRIDESQHSTTSEVPRPLERLIELRFLDGSTFGHSARRGQDQKRVEQTITNTYFMFSLPVTLTTPTQLSQEALSELEHVNKSQVEWNTAKATIKQNLALLQGIELSKLTTDLFNSTQHLSPSSFFHFASSLLLILKAELVDSNHLDQSGLLLEMVCDTFEANKARKFGEEGDAIISSMQHTLSSVVWDCSSEVVSKQAATVLVRLTLLLTRKVLETEWKDGSLDLIWSGLVDLLSLSVDGTPNRKSPKFLSDGEVRSARSTPHSGRVEKAKREKRGRRSAEFMLAVFGLGLEGLEKGMEIRRESTKREETVTRLTSMHSASPHVNQPLADNGWTSLFMCLSILLSGITKTLSSQERKEIDRITERSKSLLESIIRGEDSSWLEEGGEAAMDAVLSVVRSQFLGKDGWMAGISMFEEINSMIGEKVENEERRESLSFNLFALLVHLSNDSPNQIRNRSFSLLGQFVVKFSGNHKHRIGEIVEGVMQIVVGRGASVSAAAEELEMFEIEGRVGSERAEAEQEYTKEMEWMIDSLHAALTCICDILVNHFPHLTEAKSARNVPPTTKFSNTPPTSPLLLSHSHTDTLTSSVLLDESLSMFKLLLLCHCEQVADIAVSHLSSLITGIGHWLDKQEWISVLQLFRAVLFQSQPFELRTFARGVQTAPENETVSVFPVRRVKWKSRVQLDVVRCVSAIVESEWGWMDSEVVLGFVEGLAEVFFFSFEFDRAIDDRELLKLCVSEFKGNKPSLINLEGEALLSAVSVLGHILKGMDGKGTEDKDSTETTEEVECSPSPSHRVHWSSRPADQTQSFIRTVADRLVWITLFVLNDFVEVDQATRITSKASVSESTKFVVGEQEKFADKMKESKSERGKNGEGRRERQSGSGLMEGRTDVDGHFWVEKMRKGFVRSDEVEPSERSRLKPQQPSPVDRSVEPESAHNHTLIARTLDIRHWIPLVTTLLGLLNQLSVNLLTPYLSTLFPVLLKLLDSDNHSIRAQIVVFLQKHIQPMLGPSMIVPD
ncbi:putative Sec7 domain containing protein [Blattamonas nauphoetae]|uniref:Sec7 domain containing protein n=1 Tax=Blattamonas nauphoetae TaxID=2049346 RepID=A0ABQ9YJ13_9EUKA|nr:putative Sec7 domain containing protein [Blattamonas nauphoetae]